MLPHGRAVSRERYFRRKKKSSIVWTTLPSQPYVFCIIGDIFCRWTCPPRALVPWQYSCCVLHSYLVAIFACVPSSYHPVAGLRRCCPHGRAVSRERYFRKKKKSSIVWTTLPSQPYVFFIISDIFCRCTCPPRARAGTVTIFLLCVALLSGCYFAFVPSSYHPVAGLRRCCHCTGAQSHENGIFGGRKNHP